MSSSTELSSAYSFYSGLTIKRSLTEWADSEPRRTVITKHEETIFDVEREKLIKAKNSLDHALQFRNVEQILMHTLGKMSVNELQLMLNHANPPIR